VIFCCPRARLVGLLLARGLPVRVWLRLLDLLDMSLALAGAYGVFMGSYPVPIKAPEVLQARVHPIVFQAYKSTWVLITGTLFLIPVYARGVGYHFSWWGVASAAAWVPSGFCTITSVTLIGMSLTICIACSSSAVLNFLVFWLVLGEKMKVHNIGGHDIYLAPIYLGLVCLGMVGLVYAPRCCAGPRIAKGETTPTDTHSSLSDARSSAEVEERSASADVQQLGSMQAPLVGDAPGGQTPLKPAHSEANSLSFLRFFAGVLFALGSGVLAAVQYAVVNLGKRYETSRRGCDTPDAATAAPPPLPAAYPPLPPATPPSPPPTDGCASLVEEFDNFGSCKTAPVFIRTHPS
jgi:hypothetical protein